MPSDIAAVLQISGTDLQAVCQAPTINMWAKFKPIAYSQKGILSNSRRQLQNYGLINIPTWANINKMANFWFGIDTSSTNYPDCGIQPVYWGYQKPSSYFRLSDFSDENKNYGYYHEAEAPIGHSMYPDYTIDSSGNLRITYTVGEPESEAIALSDLVYPRQLSKSVGNMYFGIMLRKTGQNDCYAVTSMKVSDMTTQGANVDISGLTSDFNGVYQIFPFISADQISFTKDLGQLTNGDFIALQEPEEIAIGSTIVRMNILPSSLGAYRDTSASTRNLYANITLVNDEYSGSLGATVTFKVFNSAGTQIGSDFQRTVQNFAANTTFLLSTALDLSSLTNLRAAASVQASVYPNTGTNRATTTATCVVTDGPSPY